MRAFSVIRPGGRFTRRGSITTLIAALAFAACAQALGPTSATAMIATGGEAQCNVTPGTTLGQTPSGQPCMILEGGEIIVFEPAEEEVEISGTPPPSPEPSPSPIVGFCQRNPIVCSDGEPKPKPSRDGLHEKQTPPGPKVGKVEVKKPPEPKTKPMTEAEKKAECDRTFKKLNARGTGYVGIGRLWAVLQDLKKDYKQNPKRYALPGHTVNAENFDEAPAVAEVNKTYWERQALLAKWDGLGCADRLGKTLDDHLRE